MSFRALIIDEDRVRQQAIATILKGAGGVATIASTGAEGRHALDEKFDLVIIQAEISELSATVIVSALRRAGSNVGTPVFGLTAVGAERQIQDYLRSGMNVLISQPVSKRTLVGALKLFGLANQTPATTKASQTVLDALANEGRLKLLGAIARLGPVTATGLAKELSLDRQLAAHHVELLMKANLVVDHHRGRSRLFEVKLDGLEAVAEWLLKLADDPSAVF